MSVKKNLKSDEKFCKKHKKIINFLLSIVILISGAYGFNFIIKNILIGNSIASGNIVGDINVEDSEDVEINIDQTTTEIHANKYVEISPELKEQIIANLQDFKLKYPDVEIVVRAESGNLPRKNVIKQLGGILSNMNMGRYLGGQYFIAESNYISYNLKDEKSAKDFIETLKPYIYGEISLNSAGSSEDTIIFHVAGDPIFNQDGSVLFQ